jgi:hypothetical protein
MPETVGRYRFLEGAGDVVAVEVEGGAIAQLSPGNCRSWTVNEAGKIIIADNLANLYLRNHLLELIFYALITLS